VSTTLAETLGRERFALKTDIRKLKRLGLTLSLEVGYELSPRGQAYLDTTTCQDGPES
jgi:biotin operon repressor